MPKTSNLDSLFDRTNFGAVMHNAESSRSVGEDDCHECGEHMLDCECDDE